MLRLVYHTTVFGPLHFEYAGPRVRIGSCRDNDLVLPHPSVRPYHCTLLLEENALSVLPPDAPDATAPGETPRYGPGDTLTIGDLTLGIERSPNTIAIPPPVTLPQLPGRNHKGYWLADYETVPDDARWRCGHCQLRFADRQIHAVGIEGGRKHILCPQCSQELELLTAPAPLRRGLLGVLDSGWRKLRRAFGLPARPRRPHLPPA